MGGLAKYTSALVPPAADHAAFELNTSTRCERGARQCGRTSHTAVCRVGADREGVAQIARVIANRNRMVLVGVHLALRVVNTRGERGPRQAGCMHSGESPNPSKAAGSCLRLTSSVAVSAVSSAVSAELLRSSRLQQGSLSKITASARRNRQVNSTISSKGNSCTSNVSLNSVVKKENLLSQLAMGTGWAHGRGAWALPPFPPFPGARLDKTFACSSWIQPSSRPAKEQM